MRSNSTYRVTRRLSNGTRKTFRMDGRELQLFRAQRLKEIRQKELGVTQRDFADAVGVNLRTLQDWERGRSPMPRPVEILMNLMRKMPSVKKTLMARS